MGAGRIGGRLAHRWAEAGHHVVLGVRDPESASARAAAEQPGIEAATPGAAAEGAEVVVLAVPHGVLDEVLAGLGDLTGKVVIDCTNAVQRGMTLKYGHDTSGAEQLQARLPGAHVFKSFNAQGAENLADPVYDGVRATNFFCGDDPAAAKVVSGLVEAVGFEPVYAGPLERARLLEPMMVLWVLSAQAVGTRDLGFKLMRR